MSNTVGEIIYMAIDHHPPRSMERRSVVCHCGWKGEEYLAHLASIADGELHTARYTLNDPHGHPIRSNFG